MKKILAITLLATLIIGCKKKDIITTGGQANCHCEGSGDYTIVMEAGMGNWSVFYQPVFQELKKTHKVCILDRVGYEKNKSTNKSRDAETIAKEINDILIENNVTDSIIIAGHSLGGLHARMFQSKYPNKVAGMILIESSHPDMFDRLPSEFSELNDKQIKNLDKVIKKAQKGWLEKSNKSIPRFGLPDAYLEDYLAVTEQPEYYHTMKQEAQSFDVSLKQVKCLTDINDIPLLIIASKNSLDIEILSKKNKKYPFEDHNKKWLALQQELTNLSSQSTFATSDKNHYLHISDASWVVDQIEAFMSGNF